MSKSNAVQLAELERFLRLCEVQSVRTGVPFPLGARPRRDGVNFAIFSRHASGVRLDLFDHAEDALPVCSIILDAARNRTGDIWHVWLEGIQPGQLYGFRVAGPYAPHEGHRFQSEQARAGSLRHSDCATLRPRFSARRRLRFVIAAEGPVLLRRR